VVLLAGPGDTTDIVANELARHVDNLTVIVESAPSRTTMTRRRATRLGWPTVLGQVAFIVGLLPRLRRQGQPRIAAIVAEHDLSTTPFPGTRAVPSVNDVAVVELLRDLAPRVVVVNGTRIIARSVLDAVDAPFINMHAGITPRYRGVHGGYWALAEGHPEQVGTTVHLVDPGIDTGGVLAQATFAPTADDTIGTYPYLHLAAGLPLLVDQVERARRGQALVTVDPSSLPEKGPLYYHPTLRQYRRIRRRKSVR
jgi:methionyl-tRNA formyltransferase